jgi:hypothetical protein
MFASFKGEVHVQGEWSSNLLRFATESEAKGYAQDLYGRWTLCDGFRAEPSDDAPTHVWTDGLGLRKIEDAWGSERMPPRSVQL